MKTKQYTGIRLMVALMAMISITSLAQDRPDKPNFVILLADDLGWQDLKCYDIDEPSPIDTPYLDQLSKEGIQFWNAYSPACTCSPSRGAIMTGKSPARLQRTKVNGGTCPKPSKNSKRVMEPYYRGRLEVSETTLPEALRPYGYYSGHVGKWHMAINHGVYPGAIDHGFDFSSGTRGITKSMADRTTGFATDDPEDNYQLDENGFATDQVTVDAMAFMDEANDRGDPFFCYYAAWLVHSPMQCRTESLLIKYADRMGYDYPVPDDAITAVGQKNPYYAAMCESLDYYLHQIMTYLKETDDPRWPGHKLMENTYVFFTSDNGGYAKYTDNSPLSKGKHYSEEGGIRVPMIVIGPDVPANVDSDVMVNGIDLFPTILSMAGIPVADDVDGCDLTALLTTDPQDAALVQQSNGVARTQMCWHFPHSSGFDSTIIQDGWKLFHKHDSIPDSDQAPYKLFQLYAADGSRVDIEESNDLIASNETLATNLIANLERWKQRVGATPSYLNPNYTGTLENQDQVPVILSKGDGRGNAWVTFSTDKAQVVKANLLYTLNGGQAYEEWFQMPATLSIGRADAVIPAGTTHYLFNLIDENNFLISSETLVDGDSDSDHVPAYVYSDVIEEPDLLAEWKFNDASGSIATDSANGFDGIISNATWAADGVKGSALNFNGDALVTIPAAVFETVTNAITISMWIYGAESQPDRGACLQALDASGNRVLNIHLPWVTGKVYWDAGNSGADLDRLSKDAVAHEYKGQWNHWVFTKDTGTGVMSIYLNGELWHTGTGMTYPMNGIASATIGGPPEYTGMIDEVRIYNGILTPYGMEDLWAAYAPNIPPVANTQMVWAAQNSDTPMELSGTDAQSQPLTFSIINEPQHGSLAGTEPNLIYTPETNYLGPDLFTFKANDGEDDSEPATVSITVFRPMQWSAKPAPQSGDVLLPNLFSTAGNFVYAENTGGPELTFDGIIFQAATNSGTTILGVDAPIYTRYHAGTQISSSGMYPATSEVTPTLTGLEVGATYRVELLFFDHRDRQEGQRIYVDDEDLGQYAYNEGGSGLLATGLFTATNRTQSIKLERTNADGSLGGQVQLNALSIFEVGEFDLWVDSFSLTGVQAFAVADPDADGFDNLSEFALGGNPNQNDYAAIAPRCFVNRINESNGFFFVHNKRTDDPTLIYTIQTCTNLSSGTIWSHDAVDIVGESASVNNIKTITNRVDASQPTMFLKLTVEK